MISSFDASQIGDVDTLDYERVDGKSRGWSG